MIWHPVNALTATRKFYSCALGCLLMSIHSFAQADWELKSQSDGIKVYTRAVPGSKFKLVRAICDMPASLTQMVAVIADVKNNPKWVYHTKTTTLLKQVSPTDLFYYAEIQVPWPAENRDYVAHLTIKQNLQTKVVTVDAPIIPDYMAEKQGIVRIKNTVSKWVLTPKAPGITGVEYTLSVDPGGDAPAWLINLFSVDGPLKSIKELKAQLKKPQYRDAQLSYIIN